MLGGSAQATTHPILLAPMGFASRRQARGSGNECCRPADLALLAIVDNVHARFELLAGDFADGAAHARVERPAIGHARPVSRAFRLEVQSGPRGGLPVCVVRMRSVLSFIVVSPMERLESSAPRLALPVPASDVAAVQATAAVIDAAQREVHARF